ncbi:MAG: crotonase/enoyl-CoA hydratase family protein [Pseudomonadota bacterium]
MSEPIVTTEVSEGIATVTLNRPAKKNAMSLEMFEALPEAAANLGPDVRAVILTGAGGAFCAGLDLAAMMEMGGKLPEVKARLADADAHGVNDFQRPVTCWAALDVPVIAAIEGVCLGAGLQLALGADFRVATPDARLSIMEARWGLIPDMGITQSLPKLMRADQAKWLMMTADQISGADAERLGLVTELAADPMARAREMAQALANRSPGAVAGSKRLIEDAWGGGAEALALEARLQADLMGSPHQIEAAMANMQKRAPKFG